MVTGAGTCWPGTAASPTTPAPSVRDDGHVAALEKEVLAARGQAGPRPGARSAARRRRPAALAETAVIRGQDARAGYDFAAWAAAARPLRPEARG